MGTPQHYTAAIREIKSAILRSRYRAAALANGEMLSLYFGIGEYIANHSRKGFWGTGAIETIAGQLQKELPGLRGFSATNMKRMRQFYEEWQPVFGQSKITLAIQPPAAVESRKKSAAAIRPLTTDELIINTNRLSAANRPLATDEFSAADFRNFLRVSFTHHYEILLKTDDLHARLFYIQKCAAEFWSVEKLRYHLKSNLYASQGKLASNFNRTIGDADFQQAATAAFKDEYLLDFINLEDPSEEPDERVLEHEIVLNVRKFIMALGNDFSFVGNQYRLEVDEKEYFVDLLFFNRRLQSLVAVELKRGEFKPEYAGKLNFYLSALDEYVKLPHEKPSIGIILCKSRRKTTVEFAFRDTAKPMGVATYRLASELPAQYQNILPDAKALKKLW